MGPSTFGKALNVKDYGTRLWSRTSRNNTSVDFAKKKNAHERHCSVGQERANPGKLFVLSEVNIIAIYHPMVSNLSDMK